MHSLEEWGLAGRNFGTWITWFLIGGDLYTAYTVIAVPALLYGAGAMGFFAGAVCRDRVSVHDVRAAAAVDGYAIGTGTSRSLTSSPDATEIAG